jgi:trans-AT polyketide synthase/acyltransferase/oxidoreductase domain-containing protein
MRADTLAAARPGVAAERLGSPAFRRDYGLRYAYTAGAMYQGIASAELVIALGRADLIGFLGTGGLSLERIERDVSTIQRELGPRHPYGVNLICHLAYPDVEHAQVDIYLKHGVRHVEAAAFTAVTPALALFRVKGITRAADGSPSVPNRVIAKVSRPEVATAFMSPPPAALLQSLADQGLITRREVELGAEIPVSHDVCVEADSGGHTDGGVAFALVPTMRTLRDRLMNAHRYAQPVRIGIAGGLGTPDAIAAAFIMGADFVTTGSVNQCTVEAGASDAAKDLLQTMGVQDTAYAPAGDMFELGSRVQVLKKGLLFPARANKLYDVYRQHDSLDDLSPQLRSSLERKIFQRSLDQVWRETRAFYAQYRPDECARADHNPKVRMALVFRWYFIETQRLALRGDRDRLVDFQIHTGPALGAFNAWVRGTEIESWRHRRVAEIAERLMTGAAALLTRRLHDLTPDPA